MKKVLVQFNFPGVTTKQYDATWNDLRALGINQPTGLLHHVGAQNGNSLVVVDVWESQEAFTKFGATLGPILKKNGFPDVEPVFLPVHYELSVQARAAATL